MSYPSYKEVWVGKVKLCDDDKLRFENITMLSSELTGEPVSVIKNVEGISEQMLFSSVEFTEENENAVEQLIKDFSVYQLNQNISAETFSNIIDTGISADNLDNIKKTVAAIQANEKITWISSYVTKTNSYVEVKLREIYLGDVSNYDTESLLSMINRDGVWKVINYTRTLNVATSISEVNDTYSLCRTVKGALESIDTDSDEKPNAEDTENTSTTSITESETSQPTESNETESNVTESQPTESNVTESNVTENQPTESNETESQPTESNVSESNVTESQPTESNVTEENDIAESQTEENDTAESQPE